MSNVLYLKLISGEELVAFSEVVEEGIIITNPLELHTVNRTNGAFVRLSKWIPHISTIEFLIDFSMIILYNQPVEDIIEYYIEAINQLEEIENEKGPEQMLTSNTENYTVH